MMTLNLRFEPPEPVWPTHDGDVVRHGDELTPIEVVTLAGGMVSGHPSVAIRIQCEDGSFVIAQTSARLFVTAARGIEGRYPDLLA